MRKYGLIIIRILGYIFLTDWYNGYVDTAAAYGLITDYNSKNFAPNDIITREQAMTILARAMKLPGLVVTLNDSEVAELLANYSDAGLDFRLRQNGRGRLHQDRCRNGIDYEHTLPEGQHN